LRKLALPTASATLEIARQLRGKWRAGADDFQGLLQSHRACAALSGMFQVSFGFFAWDDAGGKLNPSFGRRTINPADG
jgi:hypothetical protein